MLFSRSGDITKKMIPAFYHLDAYSERQTVSCKPISKNDIL